MPRTISSAALAKLAQNLGTEPINIIEVQWTAGGNHLSYADRDIAVGIAGTIQTIGGLDNATQVAGGDPAGQSGQSSQIDVVLSDTDGTLKSIFDNNDIHKRPVWVYQWFDGLALTDKFLIFKGQINSPIVWKEGDRTLNFTVISQIEDIEVGFSIEEGDFINPAANLIGKAWPMCFGTVINVPALSISTARQGELATGIGIADPTLPARITAQASVLCPYEFKGYSAQYSIGNDPAATADQGGSLFISPVYGVASGCAEQRCTAAATLRAEYNAQLQFQYNSFRVFDGDKFPQGVPLTLEINNAWFDGSFTGEIFNITNRTHPFYAYPPEAHGINVFIPPQSCQNLFSSPSNTPPVDPANPGPTAGMIAKSQENLSAMLTSNFYWADPGAKVVIHGAQETIYIANILPSTILRVAAHRQQSVGQVLVTVPSEFYTIRQTDYVGYQVMEIVFDRPLSSRGSGWTDEVFVTLTSSVGPNTVDILTWLIQTYTTHGIDSTSFNHVKTLIDNYPMHFAYLKRTNVLQVLNEIAYQARCALSLLDDIFVIKYLPEDPTINDTIVASDVLANTMEVYLTETEKLVTKYTATWKEDYELTEQNKIVYHYNVAKYGVHAQTYDYYCFNIIDLVRKAATFWLIRLANTWKRVRFNTPLSKLTLEVFDCAGLTLPEVGDGQIKGVVEQASYDSVNHAVSFDMWTPIRSGEMDPYTFAYPADIDEQDLFPTVVDRNLGYAGIGPAGGPNFVTKAPANHPLSGTGTPGLFQGFNLACNGRPVKHVNLSNIDCHENYGLAKPSDRGDTKPSPKSSADSAGAQGGFDPPNAATPPCCTEALSLASRALDSAQRAQANGGANNLNKSAGADANGSAGPEDNSVGPGGQGKNSTLAKKLPNCSTRDKPGPCDYQVKVAYIIPDLIHHRAGDVPFEENKVGATGFASLSHDGGSETYAFNSFVAAKAFYISQFNVWQNAINNGTYVVGSRGPAGPTAINFHPTDNNDPNGCVNPPKNQMTCYEDKRL